MSKKSYWLLFPMLVLLILIFYVLPEGWVRSVCLIMLAAIGIYAAVD